MRIHPAMDGLRYNACFEVVPLDHPIVTGSLISIHSGVFPLCYNSPHHLRASLLIFLWI